MELPPRCKIRSGSVYYVAWIGGKRKWIKLCRVSDGESALHAAFRSLNSSQPRTLGDIMQAWLVAEHDLSPRTLREYRRQIKSILIPTFGKMRPDDLTNSHIAQFLEIRGGVKANRERAALSTVIEWAMRKGWVRSNPCRGVRRNKERPRRRYVTDDELDRAMQATTEAFAAFLWGGYLTGLRQGDLRCLRRTDATADGLELTESKRGRKLMVGWSDALRDLVAMELSRSKCHRIFTNTRGEPWNPWTIQTAMRNMKRRTGMDWNLHDLRAKAESDHAEGMGLMASYERARRVMPVR